MRVAGRRHPARHALLVAVLLVTAAAGAESTGCAPLAGQTIRWVVPNAAGGGYDTYSRLLQPFLEDHLGATLVVDNRPEAGGLVGAAAIRDARPDGRTLGIINAPGLIAAGLDRDVPDPATDFSVLGRLLSNHTVLLSGSDSGIATLDDLLRAGDRRPIVIGVRDAGSASVFAVPVAASLLGLDYLLVTGYVGNTARALAAIRGEVDILVQNFDSTRRFIEAGELRPLLQLTERAATADYTPLDGVPVLTGPTGVAAQRARDRGRPVDPAIAQARALATLIDAGRLIVAPAGLPADLRDCLETVVGDVLASRDLADAAARAQLRIEPADAASAQADVQSAATAMAEFAPLIRDAMRRARQ